MTETIYDILYCMPNQITGVLHLNHLVKVFPAMDRLEEAATHCGRRSLRLSELLGGFLARLTR